jgi:hypothetical protein
MCEPTTIALGVSAALTALGTGAQIHGQREADTERASTIRNAITEQQGARDRGMGAALSTLPAVERPAIDAAMDRAAADRGADYAAATAPQGGYLPSQAAAPQVVRDAVDRGRADTAGYLGQRSDALGRLGGWSDALFGVRQGVGRAGEGVAAATSAGRGAASLLPGALQAAGGAGSGWRLAGDLMNMAGQFAGAAGGTPGGWGSIFGSTGPAAGMPKNKPAAL